MNINTIKFIDRYFGNLICLFLSFFHRKKQVHSAESILAIQLWGIGETILTLPALDALRKNYPRAKIDILTTSRVKDVYLCYDKLNKILTLDIAPFSILKFIIHNRKKYDIVIDFEEYLNISSIIAFFVGKFRVGFSHSMRSLLYDEKVLYNDQKHVTQVFLDLTRALGINYNTEKLTKLITQNSDKAYIDTLLKKFSIKEAPIGITCGVAESSRQRIWPLERFAELADKLVHEYRAKMLFVGAPNEKELIDSVITQIKNKNSAVNFAGLTNIQQSFELISRCKLFISNDTGPMHIAAAQGVKTIGLFGPNLPVRFGPYGKNNIGIYKSSICKFSPCINVHKGDVSDCRMDTNICMQNISVDEVFKAAVSLLR